MEFAGQAQQRREARRISTARPRPTNIVPSLPEARSIKKLVKMANRVEGGDYAEIVAMLCAKKLCL